MIINHCPGVNKVDYNAKNQVTNFGLGVQYALIRRPFLEYDRTKDKIIKNIKKVLISFGGSSPINLVKNILLSIMKVESIDEIHLLGNSPIQFKDFALDERVVFHNGLDENEVFELMKSIELAIVPSSTISIELASLGIPMVLGYFCR